MIASSTQRGGPQGARTASDPAEEFARRDIEYHRHSAAEYDDSVTREHGIYHALSLEPFLDRVGRPPGDGLAVDLGCGTGVVTVALARRGYRVIGVDHSPEMLEVARAKLEGAGLGDRVELRREDLLRAELPDAAADVVTCQGVLHHLEDLRPCVDVIARLLRPGGSFYISEPCADPTPVSRTIAAALRFAIAVRRRVLRRGESELPESVEAPIRPDELRAALDKHGLRYRTEFLTHVPVVHRYLPDGVRRRLTWLLSLPWRRRRGDLVFVEGTRPGSE